MLGAPFPEPSPVIIAQPSSAGAVTASAASNTFLAMAVGAASADRIIVAGIYAEDAISAVSIGGVAATRIAGLPADQLQMWAAPVPLGATADVIITVATGSILWMAFLWSLKSAAAAPSSVVIGAGTGPVIGAIGCGGGGTIIGCALSSDPAATPATTWAALTKDGADLSENDGTTNFSLSGAHSSFLISRPATNRQAAFSAGTGFMLLVAYEPHS